MNKEQILEYGLMVFNNEEDKFNRWLVKENKMLGNISPKNLLDYEELREEVEFLLNRIEYGNFN